MSHHQTYIGGYMKILVVDDEHAVAVMLGRTLERLGHTPMLSEHPGDALAMLDADIDAVITDIDMPDMNGVELARAIRDVDEDMPIAFCTGSNPAGITAREAASLGPVLSKVWTLPEIESLVRSLESEAERRFACGSGEHPAVRITRPTVAATRERRYRVHLRVRYGGAREFVSNYVENLCSGGMFIRDAHELYPLEEVSIAIELPGFGDFEVMARVVYVLGPDDAEACGRQPGAGLHITESNPLFQAALRSYLQRLERRRQLVAFATTEACRDLLDEAGFQAKMAPAPEDLRHAVTHTAAPVAAVIVSRAEEAAYRSAADALGSPHLIRAIDYLEELDIELEDLDVGLI